MGKRRIYLLEWRKKNGLTQKQVVDRLSIHEDDLLPTTTASLSRLENGKQQYSQRVLEALADIYDCEPGDLIGRNPLMPGDIVDLVSRLDEQKRAHAMAVIEALASANGG